MYDAGEGFDFLPGVPYTDIPVIFKICFSSVPSNLIDDNPPDLL